VNLAVAPALVAVAALGSLFNGGRVRFYTDPMPATPETPIGAQTLLAELLLASPAFAIPSFIAGYAGATANFIVPSVLPVANGLVTWARGLQIDGTPVADLTVGTNAADILVANVSLVTTINLLVASFRLQLRAA
jgi:hypothetical protein